MKLFELPIENQGLEYYKFNTNLDGQNYGFRFRYNRRNDTWYVTIYDSNEQVVISDAAVLSYMHSMTARLGVSGFMPFGDLYCSDVNSGKEDPSYNNFGKVVKLFYMSLVDEVP